MIVTLDQITVDDNHMRQATKDELKREYLVFRHTARYGQHPETEARYREAVIACKSFENLTLTIQEIARMYDLKPECLRNQLKRHFPNVIQEREKLRDMMGYAIPGNKGLKNNTIKQYAEAIEMLRDASLTVKEVASRCGVSYQGLQQHLIFYHKDIAEKRMLSRTDSLLRPVVAGTITGSGGIHQPRPGVVALYAPALELYRTTQMSVPEIAKRCGVAPHNFESYIRKWHKDDMEERRLQREERIRRKKEQEETRSKCTLSQKARMKYGRAVEYLSAGMTLTQTASELGVDVTNLSGWLRRNQPEVLEICKVGMMRLPSGKLVSRKTWEKYEPVAQYVCTHPSKPTVFVAEKFAVPTSSLVKHLSVYYPDVWERHCRCCAEKAAREREKLKKEGTDGAAPRTDKEKMVREKYAAAIELYSSGKKSVAQVAEESGLGKAALGSYLRAHHPDLIENRCKVHAVMVAEAKRNRKLAAACEKKEQELRKAERRYGVIPKYEPAVDEYREGQIGLKPLASKYGFTHPALRNYIGTRYPELIQARKAVVEEALRRKYADAAKEILSSRDSIAAIAVRHGLSRNGFRNYIMQHGPHLMEIHKAVTSSHKH